ncbi:hypothetical protein VTO73DRAFT_8515 [Trametes versicolor]
MRRLCWLVGSPVARAPLTDSRGLQRLARECPIPRVLLLRTAQACVCGRRTAARPANSTAYIEFEEAPRGGARAPSESSGGGNRRRCLVFSAGPTGDSRQVRADCKTQPQQAGCALSSLACVILRVSGKILWILAVLPRDGVPCVKLVSKNERAMLDSCTRNFTMQAERACDCARRRTWPLPSSVLALYQISSTVSDGVAVHRTFQGPHPAPLWTPPPNIRWQTLRTDAASYAALPLVGKAQEAAFLCFPLHRQRQIGCLRGIELHKRLCSAAGLPQWLATFAFRLDGHP